MIALLLCFTVYIGFQFLAAIFSAPFDLIFMNLGIHEHYLSVQRGVIDSRDIIYYFSAISLFLLLTKLALQTRKW
jgi:ABC-2 type transport system permease protein